MRILRGSIPLLLALGAIANGGALTVLRVAPADAPSQGELKLTVVPGADSATEWRERRQLEVVITEAYARVSAAKTVVALTPQGAVLTGTLRYRAEPGVFAMQGARGNEALTTRTTFAIAGLLRADAWWLPNGLPLLGLAGGEPAREGFNSLRWRELTPPARCLVEEAERTRWLKALSSPGGGEAAALVTTMAAPAFTAPCGCAACRAGFGRFVATRFQNNLAEFNRLFGLELRSFSELAPPASLAVSPALSRLWQDYQFQRFPDFIAWVREQLQTTVVATMPFAPALVEQDGFHAGINLSQLAETADGLLARTEVGQLPALASLLVTLCNTQSDPELIPDRPAWLQIAGEASPLTNVARVEAYLRGVTGVVHDPSPPPPGDQSRGLADSARFLFEHAGLFLSARSLTDLGVVFNATAERLPREGMGAEARRDFSELVNGLANRGWAPRAVWSERADGLTPEAAPVLFVPAHGAFPSRFLERLRRYVESGGRAYVEGLTLYDAEGRRTPWPLRDLVNVELTPLPTRVTTTLALEDLFVFGRARRSLRVEQHGVIGKTAGARILARFADGSPGLVWRRVGRGEVYFTPARVARLAAGQTEYADYWHAVAASCSRQLVHIDGDRTELRSAALRTRNLTLFGVFNYGRARQLELTLEAPLRTLTDLRTGRRLVVADERARYKTVTLDLPARDWLVLANADSGELLEKELRQPRLKFNVLEAR